MKLKQLFSKFKHAVSSLYGQAASDGRTKAARESLDAEVSARPGTFEGAIAARFVRDIRNAELGGARKNTRGLPKGYGAHQAKRARLLARSKKHRDRATLTELYAAQTFIDDEKRCNRMRAAARARLTPDPVEDGLLAGRASRSFLKRVCPAFRSKSLRLLQAIIRRKRLIASQSDRVPYRKPVETQRDIHGWKGATVTRLPGDGIEVRPLPSAA
jgi:hypothetical protein